jgi:hypothetical protein
MFYNTVFKKAAIECEVDLTSWAYSLRYLYEAIARCSSCKAYDKYYKSDNAKYDCP